MTEFTRNQVGEMQSVVARSKIRGPMLNKVTIQRMLVEYQETLPRECTTCAGDGACPTCKGTGSAGSDEALCWGCQDGCERRSGNYSAGQGCFYCLKPHAA